jgi:hypothetical protein
MRLLHTQQLRRLRLRQPTLTDDPVNLEREPRLHHFLFRVRQAKISKNISAARGNFHPPGCFPSAFRLHDSILPLVVIALSIRKPLPNP